MSEQLLRYDLERQIAELTAELEDMEHRWLASLLLIDMLEEQIEEALAELSERKPH